MSVIYLIGSDGFWQSREEQGKSRERQTQSAGISDMTRGF
jgi:hypothetical protein